MDANFQQKSYTTTFIIAGPIVHAEKISSLTIIEHGFVAVVRGRIMNVSKDFEKLKKIQYKYGIDEENVYSLRKGEFLMPGFIDTHFHAPQYPTVGLGYDKQLIEWLSDYIYPLERKFCDRDFASKVYESVVRKTLDSGTTTVSYFESIFYDSSLILADIVERAGQRAFIGKVNMNCNTPNYYGEKTRDSLQHSEEFIRFMKNKKNKLIQPIITPRSAMTCDMEIMKLLAEMAARFNLNIQTHAAETLAGIKKVQTLHPGYENETEVYNEAGLLTNKTILAHGVYLNDQQLKILAAKDTSISHCPNSNTSLKSGLCDVRRLLEAGLKVGLGTDVSGGYGSSMLNAIRSALQVSTHVSFRKGKDYIPLTYHEVVYLATLGGARALSIEDKTGNFKVGKDFDALIVNLKNPGPIDLLDEITTKELLEKFIFSGDDRNISKVFVAGRQVK